MNILKSTSIFLLFILCSQIKAQEKFTTYDNTYIGKSYEIQISNDKGKFKLFIDALSVDTMHEKGGILVEEKNYPGFIDALSEAKLKYEEWVRTAQENNVKELNKEMKIKSKVSGYFLYGSKWNFQFLVNLKFDFKIIDSKGEIKYLLLVRTGELQSSSNQFMKVDGFLLVFSSSDEIDDFLNSISIDKIIDFTNKPKNEDLFKD